MLCLPSSRDRRRRWTGPAPNRSGIPVKLAGALPEPLSISSLVGCYTTGESLIGLDSIPAELTLLQAPQDAMQGWSPHHQQNACWRILPDDTLEYVEGNSLYGWRFRGVRQADALAGKIDGWTDVAGPPRSALPCFLTARELSRRLPSEASRQRNVKSAVEAARRLPSHKAVH